MTVTADQLREATRVCACFNLRRAARLVTRLYDEALEPGGLRSSGFVALAVIHAEDGPSLPRLARALGIDRSTLTRNLKPLERDGLVRVKTGAGGRTALVDITRKGVRTLERCVPLWQRAQQSFEASVGGSRWAELLGGLDRIVAALPDA